MVKKKFESIEKYKYLVLLLGLFIFVSFMAFNALANVNYTSNQLQTNYSAGDTIRGRFNINIINHPANSMLTSNFLGNITLIDFLRGQQNLVEGVNYSCSVQNCAQDFTPAEQVSNLQLMPGIDSYVGFKFEGPGITISDASITISSNAPVSCTPNLYVDLFADDSAIITSNKGSGQSCGVRHVGCYNVQNTLETPMVTGKEYCEKIRIPAGPSFLIGGRIRQGTGASNLTMRLYDFDSTQLLGSCSLPQNTQQLDELKCEVNYSSSTTKDYFVCISTGLNNSYKIGAETTAPNCGTAIGFNSLTSDVDLFAETTSFAASPTITINQSTYQQYAQENLIGSLEGYLQGKYNSNCQPNSCFIPIKLNGLSQTVNFENSNIPYQSVGFIYNSILNQKLNYEASKINANNISLDISKANFVIPIESTNDKFKLYIDGNQVFEKPISIRRSFSFDVNPKIVPFGQNTLFTASSSAANITRTIWSFGDGTSVQTVEGRSVSHTFTKNETSYDINVTAISNQTQATRQFKIYIGSPRELANLTIADYKKRIGNITKKIDSYPSWTIQKIKDKVDTNYLTNELNSIEIYYNNASTETEYRNVMLDLIALNFPKDIATTISGDRIPLSVGYQNFNVDYIEKIENKDISDNTALRDRIVGWMDSNFDADISFENVEIIGDYGSEKIMTLFTLRINPKGTISSKVYLVLGQNIKDFGAYRQDYKAKSLESGVEYIELDTSGSQTIEFLLDGEVDAENLGAYISPSLEVLGEIESPEGNCNLNNICEAGENSQTCPEDCSKRWFKFTLIGWILLFFGALITYIILQEWYKKHYQKSLFPDNNELYNLVNFIYNTRKSGLNDSEIASKLREQEWSRERIRFAFRRIDGKRVGMLEIPLFTRKEHQETVKQIANRQPRGKLDARFIKRSY